MCEIMAWSDNKTNLMHNKTFPQDYDYELLNAKQNENSHQNTKGTDAVKPISDVPLRGTIRCNTGNRGTVTYIVVSKLDHY